MTDPRNDRNRLKELRTKNQRPRTNHVTTNYVEISEMIVRLVAEGATPTGSDQVVMENVIEGASRAIEVYCGRRFYPATETRYYTAAFSDELFIDDLISVTTLQTDEDGDRTYEITWATTDYDLLPDNAALTLEPYTLICTAPDGRYSFPAGIRKGVKIAGSFGYAALIPAQVREACLIQAVRLFKRKDAPFGVAGNAELGELRVISKLDPDVEMMLAPLRRLV